MRVLVWDYVWVFVHSIQENLFISQNVHVLDAISILILYIYKYDTLESEWVALTKPMKWTRKTTQTPISSAKKTSVCYTNIVDITVRYGALQKTYKLWADISVYSICDLCVWIHASDEARHPKQSLNIFIGAASYHVVTALKRETLAIIRKRTKRGGQGQQLSTLGWVTLGHFKHPPCCFVTEHESSSSSSYWWFPQRWKTRVGHWFWLKSNILR